MFTNKGFRILRIWGVDVEIDISWFLIAVLVVWAGTRFYSGELFVKLGVGMLFAVLFFVGLFLHEFSHTVVSKLRGINVPRMRFGLLGAAAFMETQPRGPKDEFLIGVAGPLTSFLIAVGYLVCYQFFGFVQDSKTLSSLVVYLAVINGVIGAFNSLPAYPLDGGRFIARALLWKVSGDARWSMKWATKIGELFGWLMIGTGIAGTVFLLLGPQVFFNSLWLLLIGFFLANAAKGSYRAYILTTHTARDCMKPFSIGAVPKDAFPVRESVVPADMTLDKVIEKAIATDAATELLVEEDGEIIGTLSPFDIKAFIKKQ